MPPNARREDTQPKRKLCPVCEGENELSAKVCHICDTEFLARKRNFVKCEQCEALNPKGLLKCQNCGHSFTHEYVIELKDALRTGAIIRGGYYSEDEVREAEKIIEEVKSNILASGDASLLKVLKLIPDEAMARLGCIIESAKK